MSEYRNYSRISFLEPHYSKHVSAMTGEKLHCKGDIAAELAYRDMRIEELEKVVDTRNRALQESHERMQNFEREIDRRIESLGPLKIMADNPAGFMEALHVLDISWPYVTVAYPSATLK